MTTLFAMLAMHDTTAALVWMAYFVGMISGVLITSWVVLMNVGKIIDHVRKNSNPPPPHSDRKS